MNRALRSTLTIGTVLLAGNALAQEVAPPADTHFVGLAAEGTPADWLSQADMRLLTLLHTPLTPNEILQRGVPFQASQLQRLQRAGYLMQDGDRFRSSLPMLDATGVAAVRGLLRDSLDRILGAVRPSLAQLNADLVIQQQAAAYPALVNWVVRERMWGMLLESGTIDLDALILEQRAANPTRGWYGVLWMSPQPEMAQAFLSRRREDRAVLLAWGNPSGSRALDGAAADRFLGDLRGDGSRVGNRNQHPDLLALDLIDATGNVKAPVMRWEPDRPGTVAAALENVTLAFAEAFREHVPVDAIAGALGSRYRAEAYTVAYVELMSMLIDALAEDGFPVILAGAVAGGATAAGDGGFVIPLHGGQSVPRASGVIWLDAEDLVPPRYPITW